MRLLLHWLISAASLLIVANVVSGIQVDTFGAALIAALVYGLISVTLGLLLKLVSLPLIILTLGLFWFVINALMLQLASALVPGFRVRGFFAAFVGALLLSIVQWLLSWLLHV
ncbi:phage holin family protein [Nevskia soli]|jgi:putative membrane protein|uniref:phage holin family protein n=1 Tax=Nevskia soli TaxID=418856 RepID=UPI0015D91D63|nr:phage holin family protein [Nevskia soli]